MQLSILLFLIRTKGVSLPDKRTHLYDRYVDVFFDREAEKTEWVLKHRPELEGIHQALGWKLHAAAEVGGDGTIPSMSWQISSTRIRTRGERRDRRLTLDQDGGARRHAGVSI